MMSRICAARRLSKLALAGVLSFLALVPLAHADGPRLQSGPVLPAYRQECGSCHLAYPAGLLPASSWRRLMDGLEKHFGTDASLDAPTTRRIDAWLQQHAATGGRTAQAPPQDRITRSSWFERKHRKIDPAVWRHASVKSAANCAACHAGAAQGDFDDDRIQVPPGLDARQRRAFQDD
ncbi:diheme cytochrome c [Comamonadaceae bacterium G21597-S1]|nr:diheme cytochrome c [Comamonadaceae bacterium G21597-S1]